MRSDEKIIEDLFFDLKRSELLDLHKIESKKYLLKQRLTKGYWILGSAIILSTAFLFINNGDTNLKVDNISTIKLNEHETKGSNIKSFIDSNIRNKEQSNFSLSDKTNVFEETGDESNSIEDLIEDQPLTEAKALIKNDDLAGGVDEKQEVKRAVPIIDQELLNFQNAFAVVNPEFGLRNGVIKVVNQAEKIKDIFLNGKKVKTHDMTNLSEGEYFVHIIDIYGKEHRYNWDLKAENPNEENYVYDLNSKNEIKLFAPKSTKVIIYDKVGQEKNSFILEKDSFYFQAKDSNGNDLSPGLYMILLRFPQSNFVSKIEVTVF